mmetsp:Transcript_31138/g.72495  ORF Transcript_31138/g.72495 Transcript_31138/m.72495 type:complete len:979 (-) Transcript_31138:262-3198(-)|eukprot:CAMPEP_0178399700 /NCGR_PEP_ID=MMETSP0689_2-20121128/15412_1 /TAXON_ID=160604 /ORGANISM="Amphidinium massartii, Strain CS-259" /LENGTH=978 /DNA_ID=CAMNT_0020020479 /DNA_START=46 /DNA_END=2982 /DNA_ORIENTATION=+
MNADADALVPVGGFPSGISGFSSNGGNGKVNQNHIAMDAVAEACSIFIADLRADLRNVVDSYMEECLGPKAPVKLAYQVFATVPGGASSPSRKRTSSHRSNLGHISSRHDLRSQQMSSMEDVDQVENEVPTCRETSKTAMSLSSAMSPDGSLVAVRASGTSSPVDADVQMPDGCGLRRQFSPEGARVLNPIEASTEMDFSNMAPRHAESGRLIIQQTSTGHTTHHTHHSNFTNLDTFASGDIGTVPSMGGQQHSHFRRSSVGEASEGSEVLEKDGSNAPSITTTAFLLRHSIKEETGSARSQLNLDEVWDYNTQQSPRNRRGSARLSTGGLPGALKNRSLADPPVRSGDCVQGTGSQWMLHPNSVIVMTWDLWTLLTVTHDMIIAPLVAFVDADLARTKFVSMTEAISFVTWVLDIAMSCCKGYVDGNLGIVELRPRMVLANYARTWLLFDILLVSVDIAMWVMASAWTELLGALRIVRMFRIGRMLRLLKVTMRLSSQRDTAHFLVNHMPSATGTILGIVRNLLVIMLANHFAACGWYALGSYDPDPKAPGWISLHDGCEEMLYCYATAYHFTMTQFTPSSIRVDAGNTAERVYEVFCIILGLVVFSAFLGSMTQNLLHYRQMTATENEQRLHAMRYLNQHKVSVHLAARILAFLRNQSPHNRVMKFSDLHGLENMPVMLHRELQEEVFTPTILRHPLFARMWGMDVQLFNRLCHQAIWEKSLVQGEEAFVPEAHAECMYFVMSGMLTYFHMDRPFDEEKVEVGARIAEVALWASWKHHGRCLGAAKSTGLALLSARELKLIIKSSGMYKEFAVYARFFISRCTRVYGGESRVSDLFGTNDEIRPVIAVAFALDRMQASFQGGRDGEFGSASSPPRKGGSAGETLMAFAEKDEACFLRTVVMAWSFAAKSQRQGRKDGVMAKLRNLATDFFGRRRIPLPRNTWAQITEGLRPLGQAKKPKGMKARALSREMSMGFAG